MDLDELGDPNKYYDDLGMSCEDDFGYIYCGYGRPELIKTILRCKSCKIKYIIYGLDGRCVNCADGECTDDNDFNCKKCNKYLGQYLNHISK